MVVSVIFSMSILKSPIINDGLFVLDSLCSTVSIYSFKTSRLAYMVDGMSHQLMFS